MVYWNHNLTIKELIQLDMRVSVGKRCLHIGIIENVKVFISNLRMLKCLLARCGDYTFGSWIPQATNAKYEKHSSNHVKNLNNIEAGPTYIIFRDLKWILKSAFYVRVT